MIKTFQLRYTSNAKCLAVLNGYIFVPFRHTPVPIKLTCLLKYNFFIFFHKRVVNIRIKALNAI